MAKNKKTNPGASPLTWVIRILIVVIFLVAVAIAINRIAEAAQNDREKEKLETAAVGAVLLGEEQALPLGLFVAPSDTL